MENAGYVVLSRQSGLIDEMRVVANNIANAATTGYRQEGLVFSEYVDAGEGRSSLSMAEANIRNTSRAQGALTETGGAFDLAIEGDGYFLIETPGGERLTRAGSFAPNAFGELVNADGHRVLDAGGAPIIVPPDSTGLRIAFDGTISNRDGTIGQVGVVVPGDPMGLVREDGVRFRADGGTEPAENIRLLQGFLEGSNVNPILQVARMVEIQRGYELGQSFLNAEDERIRQAVKVFVR
ncbi:flagellar hook-basal body complex protein [Pukyongiella litopenaei]|uniref:Flagellar basal-body rod protein FlgF n=1 Tax=Pukyongiella litopenaei TaxID=2605946 RepID=A0A2S0MRU5_9RHOB|nr:flagellar hook-basal body complex protein [Pukyongiella litopenaei]AVO38547.1 flagellar hook-basal body complex protein [Pukyongiella litopenaei]